MLFLSALAAYFMDSFGIHINREMLENVDQTNPHEALDLLTGKLALYLISLGRLQLSTRSAGRALLVAALEVLVGCILAFGSFYATFGREHKMLRSGINPGYPLYSLVQLARHRWQAQTNGPPTMIGADARISYGRIASTVRKTRGKRAFYDETHRFCQFWQVLTG